MTFRSVLVPAVLLLSALMLTGCPLQPGPSLDLFVSNSTTFAINDVLLRNPQNNELVSVLGQSASGGTLIRTSVDLDRFANANSEVTVQLNMAVGGTPTSFIVVLEATEDSGPLAIATFFDAQGSLMVQEINFLDPSSKAFELVLDRFRERP